MVMVKKFAAVVLGITLAAPVAANLNASVIGYGFLTGQKYAEQSCSGCWVEVAGSGTSASASTAYAATAMAAYGVLKGSGAASGSGDLAQARGNFIARFSDTFTVNAAGMTGHGGVLTVPIDIGFSLDRQYAELDLSLIITYAAAGTGQYYRRVNGRNDGAMELPLQYVAIDKGDAVPFSTRFNVEIPFSFGSPIAVSAWLSGGTTGATDASRVSFSGLVDVTHSVYWGGFASVLDASGMPVNAFSVLSTSGTDWSHNMIPVPEPAAWVLFVAGAMGLALCRATCRRERMKERSQALPASKTPG